MHDERHRTPATRCFLTLLLCTTAMVGCGGGGGASSSGPTPTASGAASPPPATPAPAPAPVNDAPTAAFAITDGDDAFERAFDGAASSDADGSVDAWLWDFGDGSGATGALARHRYDAAGSYTVSLTVSDDDGAEAVSRRTIEITAPEGRTIAGTLRIQAASVVDTDTNDPDSSHAPNDTLATAQPIPNPATVGGYVAGPGRGTAAGALHVDGDRVDVFRLRALGGERIVLDIGSEREDLDLRLYDTDGVLVAESLGIDRTESLDVPDVAGEYRIEVAAFARAASTYLLTVGRGPDVSGFATGSADLVSSAEFVADEVLLGPELRAARFDEPAIVRDLRDGLRDDDRGVRRARLEAGWRARSAGAADAAPLGPRALAARRTLEAVKHLRASGRYAWVEPNWIRRPLLTPVDGYFPNQWNLHTTRFSQAWDLQTGDADVVVAVLDTGILTTHPEFGDPASPGGSRLVPGYDFVSDLARAGDGDGRDADPSDPGDGGLAGSSSFHGTHVAGIVAARTGDGGSEGGGGIAGAAFGTRIMPLRVLGIGGGTSGDLVEALRYAGGLPNATGEVPERPADIINLSLGATTFSQAEQDAIDALRERGIIVIAAAGNEASSAPTYPAAYAGVVSVSATTITDEAAYYSNRGASVDIAAPGGDTSTDVNGDGIADGIISTSAEDTDDDASTPPSARLGVLAGTSMAAPHVAAAAALMKAAEPTLTPADFDALLAAGRLSVDLGAPGRDDVFGHGLLDARQAVLAAMQLGGALEDTPGVLVASPSTLNFGPFVDELEFRLSNEGSLALTAATPVADVDWIEIRAADVDGDGLGVWVARVLRDRLPGDGLFRAGIRIASDANTAWVDVQVQRSAVDLDADLGFLHVLLIPATGGEAAWRTTATARGGQYDFRFDDVAAGRYHLIAGTDADFDGVLCEAGEACGAWRTLAAPTVLEIGAEDRTDLEFVAAFRTALSPGGPLPASE